MERGERGGRGEKRWKGKSIICSELWRIEENKQTNKQTNRLKIAPNHSCTQPLLHPTTLAPNHSCTQPLLHPTTLAPNHSCTQSTSPTYCEDFRGDVIRCPHCRGTGHLAVGVHLEARAKVGQSDVAVLVYKDIVRFDVSAEGGKGG